MIQKSGVVLPLFFVTLLSLPVSAQQFFNLTAQEVKIDSVLPVFNYAVPLGYHYADSTYEVMIDYPEFIPMSEEDIRRYHELSDRPLAAMPEITQSVSVDRKQGNLIISFMPLVLRNGQYQKLVSFQLKVQGTYNKRAKALRAAPAGRYVANSVLASGRWAKISVPSTGVYQLTDALIKEAGFSDLSKVKIYGYGGAMQPEKLTATYLADTDDLKELPTCQVDGKRIFYGIGPVSWDSNHQRIRNPYATAGCYFLTESDAAPKTISWETFKSTYYPLADDYCNLYEVDDYAWFQGGRNLYDARVLPIGQGTNYTVRSTGASSTGSVTVVISAAPTKESASVAVKVNGTSLGSISLSTLSSYDKMKTASRTFSVTNLKAENTITLTPNANSGVVRLDYISIYASLPRGAFSSGEDFPVPSFVETIYNQNRHADGAADMVIIVPKTQKLTAQAVRLKNLHERVDGFRVTIVPANELFNEFSSGTPDANAYRRYMKMLYDRAATTADMPRYLLLLGDCAWDNRMLCSEWKDYSPDDFLLGYESDNSFSQTKCYISDDYFCLLDDDEGSNIKTDVTDIGVGRIPARDNNEAAGYVDKVISYTSNELAGSWQNLICFMGDDGNDNKHMQDADKVATMVETNYPNIVVKRIMWDAYNMVSSSTGNSYPDVTRLIKQQMQQGALMMNYSGHGGPGAISHEYVLRLNDFSTPTSLRLPLWLTASCEIMPFDGQEDNIGETALFNKKGGCIAIYGTTRTVYQPQNLLMNLSFTNHVLRTDDEGKPYPIGEAVRLTKNELITTGVVTYDSQGNPQYSVDRSENRLQYSLLGDPAVRLAIPVKKIELESINDIPLSGGTLPTVKAGSTAKVTGRIVNSKGQTDTDFNGSVTGLVRDVKELVTCRLNNTTSDGASVAFTYYDRPNTIYNGSNQVTKGQFSFTFAVPKDIKYSKEDAQINLYAVNNEKTWTANGMSNQLALNGTAEQSSSELGPDIYCYLNSESFSNGGEVNSTPYFVAELNDEDGLNASGSGIGHDLLLIIDGNVATTYTLNDYFNFDFGSYTKGKVGYSIPKLSYGQHKLQFRAWDVLNNSSITELTFNVVKGLEPVFVDVECSPNPAKTSTSFRITHDRIGTEMDVKLDVFDTSGRHLWTYSENGVPTDNTYTVNWNLNYDGGRHLNTGLYLYRLSISSEGSTYATKAKKLIVIN